MKLVIDVWGSLFPEFSEEEYSAFLERDSEGEMFDELRRSGSFFWSDELVQRLKRLTSGPGVELVFLSAMSDFSSLVCKDLGLYGIVLKVTHGTAGWESQYMLDQAKLAAVSKLEGDIVWVDPSAVQYVTGKQNIKVVMPDRKVGLMVAQMVEIESLVAGMSRKGSRERDWFDVAWDAELG